MTDRYYSIVPLGVQLSQNHIIDTHPIVLDSRDYRTAIFAASLVLSVSTGFSVVLRLVRSWQAQRRFEWHDSEFRPTSVLAV